MNKDDQERLLELKARVWAHAARNLLNGEKDPYEIGDATIEQHLGRRDKALRLLKDAGVIEFARSADPSYYRGPKITYTIKKFEESKEIATYPEFIQTWQEYHREMFGSSIDSMPEFDAMGYHTADHSMSCTNVLYIYWHQDEFDTTVYHSSTQYYPKNLREIRIKAILRAAVENHFQTDYPKKLERYLGIPEESFKTEGQFTIEPRNFAAYAACFTQDRYTGPVGYLEEYTHYRDYFDGLIQHLTTVDRMVKDRGGHAAIVKEMRQDSIQQLLYSAPINVNYVPDSKPYGENQEEGRNKYIATFLLKHTDYFDYDILYESDTTIEHISSGNVGDIDEEYKFRPTEDTIKVVEDLKKGRRACLAQTISEIWSSTSKTALTT